MGNKKTERELLLSENILPMQESGQLNFIKGQGLSGQSELGFGIFFADGHTDKQMIPHIQYNGKTIVLWLIVATAGHIPFPT
jgi:hypothetical protein